MSRWFRLSDDVINDPKILKLPEATRWQWVALLCVASKHDGKLPPLADVALLLRMPEPKAAKLLTSLSIAGLIDKTETGFAPHNWNGRQFKSDVTDTTNAVRQQRYRNKHRNGESNSDSNAVTTVTAKRPETETETEKNSEAIASGAVAPIDHRKRLFDEGLSKLASLTGKGPDACRGFVGKCLKASGDDAVTVLGLIEEAERNQVVDPSAWIAARLKPTAFPQGNSNGRRTVHDAANDLSAKLRALDEPAPGLRDGSGESPVRLLSAR